MKVDLNKLLAGLLLLVSAMVAAQNDRLFEEANTLYNEGRYQEALQQYKKISESGVHSAELYYNMGNTYYKLNNIAPSILYYEKALVLDPDDADVKVNLAYARNMTIDDIQELPRTGIARLFNGVIGKLGYETWTYLSIASMFLFVALFIAYYFAYAQSRKRLLFAGSGIVLIFSLVSLLFAFQLRSVEQAQNPAIVFAEETTVKSEPNLGSDEVFRLHEGTKVFILDSMNDWRKIRLTDGKEGWLPGNELRVVKDF